MERPAAVPRSCLRTDPAAAWRPVAGAKLRGLTIAHALGLWLLVTWGYGGQIGWVRQAIALGGAATVILILLRLRQERSLGTGGGLRELACLWPLWALDALAVLALLNPSFRDFWREGAWMMTPVAPLAWLPSTARPSLAAGALWQFNVLVLTAWNLFEAVRSRRRLRVVLLFAGVNAAVLAVMGTLQHLLQAKGIWFGRVEVPNARFFATFVYPNHWGAFMLLALGGWLGWLVGNRRGLRSPSGRWAAVIVLLLALTAPLSGSRSSSVLAAVLLAGAAIDAVARALWSRDRRRLRAAAAMAGLLLVGGTWGVWVARGVVAERVRLTRLQAAAAVDDVRAFSRLTLYRDTWRMAAQKPAFGWGLASYPHVFRWFNTQRSIENLPGRPFYREAHSDWLQSLAEVGIVGTLLRLALVAGLWRGCWRSAWREGLPRGLLGGCAVVVAYAALEFPFANPAVVFSFWAALLGARRWARLADERTPAARR